jgi:hypothetical protein
MAVYGAANYVQSFQAPTAENTFALANPPGWQTNRATWNQFVTTAGTYLGAEQPMRWSEAQRMTTQRMAEAERLGGVPIGQLSSEQRMAALNWVSQQPQEVYGESIWAGFDETQRLQQLSRYTPYTGLSGVSQDQLFTRMTEQPDWWVNRAISAGVSDAELQQYGQIASQMNMGPAGLETVTTQALGVGDSEARRAWSMAMEQYAPLSRFGFDRKAISGLAAGGQLVGQEAIQYQRLLSGDRYAWSSMARQGMAPQWAQTMEAGGLQAGTTTLMGLAPSPGFGYGPDVFEQAPMALWSQTGGTVQIGGGQAVQLQYGGAWGAQDIATAEQRRYQDWQVAQQRGQFVAGAQYQGQRWQLQDVQQGFGDTWQRTQFGFQAESLQLSDRQFWERMGLQERRLGVQTGQAEQDLLTQYQRGMTRLGWSEQDLITNTERQRTQFGWQAIDIARQYGQQQVQFGWQEQAMATQAARATTQYGWNVADVATSWQRQQQQFGWQRQDVGRAWSQQQTQFGWAAEDLAQQRATSSLQFGWQMEDYEEDIRFATGRARERMMTQQERSVVMRNIQVGGMQTEEERMEERERWATEEHQVTLGRLEEREQQAEEDHEKTLERMQEQREWQLEDQEIVKEQFEQRKEWYEEDHDIQVERLQERRSWLEEDFDKESDRIETRRRWLDEDYNRDRERHGQQIDWAKEDLELQKKHHIEDMDLSTRRHEASVAYFEESIQYRDQLKELDRKKWVDDLANSARAMTAAEENRHVMRENEDLQREISRAQQKQIARWYEFWSEGGQFQAIFDSILRDLQNINAHLGIAP